MLIEDVLDVAEVYAREKHKGQFRKYGGEPYINHPKRVATIVQSEGGDNDMVVAAWLHDVVEDCGVPLTEIIDKFGPTVGAYVGIMSKEPGVTKAVYYGRFMHAPMEVCIIKLADRLDNVQDLHMAPNDFIRYYVKDTKRLLPNIEWANHGLANRIKSVLSVY